MYHCLNVVTEPEGTAGAVLFRALEPVEPATLTAKTHGPGRLTRALNIRREFHNELDMTNPTSPLQLLAGEPVDDANIVQTTRIGISLAKDYPWRFYIKDNPWVSVR
jgi:DNA-3-methyladenine glycosylase